MKKKQKKNVSKNENKSYKMIVEVNFIFTRRENGANCKI